MNVASPLPPAECFDRMRAGDEQPFVRLVGALQASDCPKAAHGLLRDLSHQLAAASGKHAQGPFVAAGQRALHACADGVVTYEKLLDRALGRNRSVVRFGIGHMLLFTTVCAVAVSFAGNLRTFAVIYFGVLTILVPMYARSMLQARDHFRSANAALRVALTIVVGFALAMSREEIRYYYPPPLWVVPFGLCVAAYGLRRRHLHVFLTQRTVVSN